MRQVQSQQKCVPRWRVQRPALLSRGALFCGLVLTFRSDTHAPTPHRDCTYVQGTNTPSPSSSRAETRRTPASIASGSGRRGLTSTGSSRVRVLVGSTLPHVVVAKNHNAVQRNAVVRWLINMCNLLLWLRRLCARPLFAKSLARRAGDHHGRACLQRCHAPVARVGRPVATRRSRAVRYPAGN